MRRLALLLLTAASPALAQHEGHGGHDAHQMDPPAEQPAPAPDPHAGHDRADPHAGHHMPEAASPEPAPPTTPPPAAARSGPAHAADAVYGAADMERARALAREEHGSIETSKILIDRLEARVGKGRDGHAWDAEAWYGGDVDKVWVKTEGEGAFGRSPEQAEVQLLWSRAIDPWFDLQAGVRYDFRPDPERGYLTLGVQGLAPYWFEVDAAAFLSEKGDVSARLEGEYDLRLTQKLILQPRLELDLALQNVPEIGVGAGLSTGEAGLRLRYEIVPEFAPYVGIGYERAFGDTARFRRAEGERAAGWNLLLGVRAWF
ncbi:MAG TPA: copper resistance protein B [Allosphingosinicella sp.]